MASAGQAVTGSGCLHQLRRGGSSCEGLRGHAELRGCSHRGPVASMGPLRGRKQRVKHLHTAPALPACQSSQWLGRLQLFHQSSSPAPQQRSEGRRWVCRAAEGPDKLCRDQVNVPMAVAPEESVAEKVKVTLLGAKGSAQVIEVPKDVYILDSAIDNNIDLPWSCRGGICGTCVGKVVKGSVDQSDISDLEFVLDEEYIQAGMALLCMARPNEDCTIETQSDWGYLMGFQDWKGASGNIGETVAADWKSISDA